MKKQIEIISKIPLDWLTNSVIHQFKDEEIVKLAISFGQNGDLTYELKLLKELCSLITKVYPLKSVNIDEHLYPVVKTLLELKKQLNEISL